MELNNSITDVPGLEVGHAQDDDALTGCTVVICREGAVCGVDVRGGAPGTRETDLLNPLNMVDKVHAVLLAGGSAFGLDAASGVMRWLDERHIGFETGVAPVPIVPAAILFDLGLGRADVRPDAAMGYRACESAARARVAEGNVGAGTGASVGKALGMEQAMKAGLGSASIDLGGGLVVGALAVVNAFGDVIDPSDGQFVAGLRTPGGTQEVMKLMLGGISPVGGSNTLLGVVAVNAELTKAQASKMAQMAQDAVARCVRPAHTMWDGDTVFALATGGPRAEVSILGAFAAEALTAAILQAVRSAASVGGLPGLLETP